MGGRVSRPTPYTPKARAPFCPFDHDNHVAGDRRDSARIQRAGFCPSMGAVFGPEAHTAPERVALFAFVTRRLQKSAVYIDGVTGKTRRVPRRTALAGTLLAALFGVATYVQLSLPVSASTTSTSTASKSAPLSVPKTTVEQDSKFFTEVTESDASLRTYEQQHGNVALEALLTDGAAFCALLKHGGGIDEALVEEAEGARSTESQTSIPLSVTTFNTIESVALLTLCRSEQKLVPASVRAKLRRLSGQLAKRSG